MSNPYEDLGVDKNADKATIKKVYRKKAQSEHPDRGGDPQKFDVITKAYKLLLDDSRRAHFDQTGQDGFEDRNTIIHQRLAALFVNVIQNRDVDRTDLIQLMRDSLTNGQGINRSQIAAHRQEIKKYELVKKRLQKKGSGPNLFSLMVDGQISALTQACARGEDEISKQQEMLDVLKEYGYNAEVGGFDPGARFGHNPVLADMVRGMQG
jgi:curved DNA-binding protein CbpA